MMKEPDVAFILYQVLEDCDEHVRSTLMTESDVLDYYDADNPRKRKMWEFLSDPVGIAINWSVLRKKI